MEFRVAGIQMTSNHCLAENLEIAKTLIAKAKEQGAELIVLPEMFPLIGLRPQEKINSAEQYGAGTIQDFLAAEALRHRIWLVGGTIPLVSGDSNKVFAASLLYNDEGQCVARYDKIHLFDVTVPSSNEKHFESDTITPGKDIVVANTPWGRLGLAVCYDIRFPEMFRQMHREGVEIIIVPAAFTYETGKAHWEILLRARAIENLCYLVSACQTGIHTNGRRTYGHSLIINPWGEVIAHLEEEIGVIVAEIDLEKVHDFRAKFPVLQHR